MCIILHCVLFYWIEYIQLLPIDTVPHQHFHFHFHLRIPSSISVSLFPSPYSSLPPFLFPLVMTHQMLWLLQHQLHTLLPIWYHQGQHPDWLQLTSPSPSLYPFFHLHFHLYLHVFFTCDAVIFPLNPVPHQWHLQHPAWRPALLRKVHSHNSPTKKPTTSPTRAPTSASSQSPMPSLTKALTTPISILLLRPTPNSEFGSWL